MADVLLRDVSDRKAFIGPRDSAGAPLLSDKARSARSSKPTRWWRPKMSVTRNGGS
jgi:hypothetical protein